MLRLFRLRGFLPLVSIAFLNAFVDLGHKVVVQNTVFKVFDGGVQIALTGLVNALILLPFVLLMTPAGFLSDRYAKPRVMRRAALAAVVMTLAITVCYYRGWFVAAFACTLLLAVQSALYGPAKLGYVKELAGIEDLAAANGLMQAASTSAILIAMLAFSFGFEHLLSAISGRDPATILAGIAPLGWYLVAAASLEYLLTLRLPQTRPDDTSIAFDVAAYRRGDYLRETLGALWRRPVLRLSVIGLSIIWSIAQVLIAVYPTFAENFLALDNVATIQLIMAAASVGMVAGSVLAASSLVNNLVMIAFLGLTVLFAWRGYSGIGLMAMLTVIAVGGAAYTVYKLPQSLVRLLIARVFALHYRLQVTGMESIPRSGGVLLLGNHVSWIDWAVVAMASPRPIRFVMARDIYERWYLRWFLDFVGVVPIAPGAAEQSLETIAALLNAGEVVCLFPEGTLSRHGQLNEFKRGFERAAAKAADSAAIIVPFYLRGLWGSQFSHSSPGLRARSLRGPRRAIVVAFGAPMPLTSSASAVKQAVSELSIAAWEDYVATLGTLPRAWLATTRRAGGEVAIVESTGRKLSRTAFACAALAFARRLRSRGRGAVGIMLPPSTAGALVNLAALTAGRTVVNLNFTASADAIRAAIARAGIAEVYTSAQFLRKLDQRGTGRSGRLPGVRDGKRTRRAGSAAAVDELVDAQAAPGRPARAGARRGP